jgi:16S rRNA (adenine1518-N6/adenine1519-N6)-dimethyltransferase
MKSVKPKKFLGQHFLNDLGIAKDIVDGLSGYKDYTNVLEVGPGMGVLTDFLLQEKKYSLYVSEIDKESVQYLKKKYPELQDRIIEGDFLKLPLENFFEGPFAIIGNFPYNISSQIFFKILEHKEQIVEVVGMLQKEVAVRLTSGPGNKDYGILSVLLQAYYDMEYLFTVDEHVFNPPPKVKSGVIRIRRNERRSMPCSDADFKKIVKQSFSSRRKTLRNALKSLNLPESLLANPIMDKRAEQLSVEDFIHLTCLIIKE